MSWLGDLAKKLRGIFGPGVKTGLEQYEFETAGPDHNEHPIVTASAVATIDRSMPHNYGVFANGYWSLATRFDIHPGRIGPAITPKSIGYHTTDMGRGTFRALLSAWLRSKGSGAAAHFLVGKSAVDGVVQMVSINRNANHMGGSPGHGWFKTSAGALVHPNTAVVGIEIDNAGLLARKADKWIHKDSGQVFSNAEVFVDNQGKGWERITAYQFEMLGKLTTDLDRLMPTFTSGTTIVPNGDWRENGVPWAASQSTRFVVHAQMDPNRKTDPGPQLVEWLRRNIDE